jgi:hypothetical protein
VSTAHSPQWSTSAAVNPLAGVVAGLLMLAMATFALEPVRRRAYELFLSVHALWPFVLLFSYLHTARSQTAAVYPMLPGLVLLLLDAAALAVDAIYRPATILSCAPVYAEEDGVKAGDRRLIAARIVIEKRSPSWWQLRHVAGEGLYEGPDGSGLRVGPKRVTSTGFSTSPSTSSQWRPFLVLAPQASSCTSRCPA